MIRINLMSAREAERHAGRRSEQRLIVLGVVFVITVVAALEFGSRMQLRPLRDELQQLEADVAQLDAKNKELTALEAQRKDLEEKLKTIGTLEEKKVGPVQVLADLGDATPNQLWLLEFTEMGGAATITGLALDNQTIAAFMRNLSSSKYFASVDLVETTQSEGGDGVPLKRFVINALLSYSGAEIPAARPNLKFPEPSKEIPQPARKGGNRA